MASGNVNTDDLLGSFLGESEERIINETTRRLRESDSEHYRDLETIDLRPRMAALYGAFKGSVLANDPTAVREFMAEVGLKRLRQGYDLGELQFAVNTMDAVIWETAREEFAEVGAGAFEALNRLSDVVGWAKDRLALVCLDETLATEAKLRRLDDIFNEYLEKRSEV
ncbi:MAG: hypothetical protein JSW52_03920 [Candidatus Coatesbacteria bacterium]|nr:MAG: hypothetical protein JSW52_03920 [Candidatus Coatesbacteria bacterium]